MKYPLLLRELIKNTEVDHKDYQNLQIAFEKIEKAVAAVNERKREEERAARMLAIQNRFDNPSKLNLVTPSRTFIREGILGNAD